MKKNIPVYLNIEKDLREKIENGRLKKGEKLPPEEKLAHHYKVSRMTIRKALSILASEGYIYRITGKGTFITSPEDRELELIKKRQKEVQKINKGIAILVPCVTFSIFAGIIRGAEDELRENGYHIMLGNYDGDPVKEREYMEIFVKRGTSGFIISPNYYSSSNPYYEFLLKKEIPFVFTDISLEGIETDLVATDNFKGGYEGTKYLISSGCRRIAFVSGWMKLFSSKERFRGYKEALEEEGIKIEKEIIADGDTSEEFGYTAIKKILSRNEIDGIFSANEPITIGILRALKELEINIPQDIKMASFDEPHLPSGLNYPIAFISQPRYEIGKRAAQLLLERIKEKGKSQKSPYRKIFIAPELKEPNI